MEKTSYETVWKYSFLGNSSSHIFKHCVDDDLKTVGRNYRNNKQKWKIAEAQLIHFRPMFHLCRNQVVGFY